MILSLHHFSAAAPVSRVGDALATELKASQFKGTLKEGFHFNEKAPNTLVLDGQELKPNQFSNRSIEFHSLPEKWSEGKAILYICDDAITFCEPRTIVLKEGKNKANNKVETTRKSIGQLNKHGFIEDDYTKALALAEKENKLVLIDFGARWCPGCVRLERETFDTKEFKDLTKQFIKLKIDTDRFENVVLSEKFRVRGIPSIVVINSKQQEIDRFMDYQPPEFIKGFFVGIQNDPATLQELTEKAKFKDSQILLRLGKRLLAAGRAQESLDYLKQIQPPPSEYRRAQVEAAAALYKADPERKGTYIKALKNAIQEEANSSRSLKWRADLIGLLDNENDQKKIRQEALALADILLSSPEKLKEAVKTDEVGEYTGFEKFMVAMYAAELANTDEALAKVAAVGKDSLIPIENVGINIRYIIVLTRVQQFEEADKLLLAMLKKNPNDPELLRRRLRVLVGQKKYKEAIQLGNKLIDRSYGRNEFYVVEVLAKAYLGADQKVEAKKLVERYLSRNEIGFANMRESKKALEELKQKAI